jgi:rRNA maturation endonuclease Nob1
MGTNQDGKNWQYACQNCGTPYTSKPKFCYDCGYRTILPITAFENTTDDCDE